MHINLSSYVKRKRPQKTDFMKNCFMNNKKDPGRKDLTCKHRAEKTADINNC